MTTSYAMGERFINRLCKSNLAVFSDQKNGGDVARIAKNSDDIRWL